MAYPVLPISVGASYEARTGRELERATNGTLRGRVSYTEPKLAFKIKHPAMTATQRDTLTAFHAANMASSFTFAWQGADYTCVFGSDPVMTAIAGMYWDVDMTLEQV